MTQKNEMSARALSMEELENVNGGIQASLQVLIPLYHNNSSYNHIRL